MCNFIEFEEKTCCKLASKEDAMCDEFAKTKPNIFPFMSISCSVWESGATPSPPPVARFAQLHPQFASMAKS